MQQRRRTSNQADYFLAQVKETNYHIEGQFGIHRGEGDGTACAVVNQLWA